MAATSVASIALTGPKLVQRFAHADDLHNSATDVQSGSLDSMNGMRGIAKFGIEGWRSRVYAPVELALVKPFGTQRSRNSISASGQWTRLTAYHLQHAGSKVEAYVAAGRGKALAAIVLTCRIGACVAARHV